MTQTIKSIALCALSVSVLSACSLFGDREPDYLRGKEGQPLEVPEGLDTPRQVSPVLIRVEPMRLPAGEELKFMPPRAAVTAGGGEANAWLSWSSSGAFLAVKDSAESVSRRIRFAIERSGMSLVRRDDEAGHVFSYQHDRIEPEKSFFDTVFFWRDVRGPDYSGTYKLRVEESNEETHVFLDFEDGSRAPSNAVEHVLGIFMERLG